MRTLKNLYNVPLPEYLEQNTPKNVSLWDGTRLLHGKLFAVTNIFIYPRFLLLFTFLAHYYFISGIV